MRKTIRLALVAAMLTAGASGTAMASGQQKMQSRVLGGYNSVATDDARVQAAAEFAAGRTNQDGATLEEVTKAERQSVQGTNFRLEFRMSNGSQWQAVVYQALDGSYTLTSLEEFGE